MYVYICWKETNWMRPSKSGPNLRPERIGLLPSCARACVRACARACMHAWMDGWMHACMYACMHACMHHHKKAPSQEGLRVQRL